MVSICGATELEELVATELELLLTDTELDDELVVTLELEDELVVTLELEELVVAVLDDELLLTTAVELEVVGGVSELPPPPPPPQADMIKPRTTKDDRLRILLTPIIFM